MYILTGSQNIDLLEYSDNKIESGDYVALACGYNGEYINDSASVIGIRPIPTAFVVLKEGRRGND